MRLSLRFPTEALSNLNIGASIALNGTCLTIVDFAEEIISFDLIASTLALTNLGAITQGDYVNFERAARIGDEIGGHLMSGHIYGKAKLVAREQTETNRILWFEKTAEMAPYILKKGFVGLNGCSLTIAEVEAERFCVYIIPETLQRTIFGDLELGSDINVEIDPQTQAIVETVEAYLAQKAGA